MPDAVFLFAHIICPLQPVLGCGLWHKFYLAPLGHPFKVINFYVVPATITILIALYSNHPISVLLGFTTIGMSVIWGHWHNSGSAAHLPLTKLKLMGILANTCMVVSIVFTVTGV